MTDFLLLSNAQPYELGVYDQEKLIDLFQINSKAAVALPSLFMVALDKYKIPKRILYAAGPGNLTSIKLGFIAAKTVAVAFDLEFYGTSSFYFNDFAPIAAFGEKTFIFKNNTIILSNDIAVSLTLPSSLVGIEFLANQTPIYPLPCVT